MIKLIKQFFIITSLLIFVFFLQNAQASQFDADLLWQTNTYVPADYQGRALPTRDSQILVIAMPIGYNANSLYYNWYLDGDAMAHVSGKGKNEFTIYVNKWPNYNYRVEVQISNNQQILIHKSINIQVQEPLIILPGCENDIITASPGKILNFTPVPYFFTSNQLAYNWYYNNQSKGNEKNLQLNVGFDEPIGSSNKLELIVNNPHNILEKIFKNIKIKISSQ